LALSHMADINERGDVRYPYDTADRDHYSPRARWERREKPATNIHINVVQYGLAKPESFDLAHAKPAPPGYEKVQKLTKATATKTDVQRGGFGPGAVKAKPQVSPSPTEAKATQPQRSYSPPRQTTRPTTPRIPTGPTTQARSVPTVRKTRP